MTAPPAPVRTTFAAPAVPNGVTTVIEVALTFVIEVPAVPPKVTAEVSFKLVPVIVTVVPPATGPLDGDTDEMVGASTNVKAESADTEPPAVVTVTATVPADFAGVTTVIDVALELTIDVPAVPPKVTAVVPVKLVPVIVTVVPPAVVPDANPVADNTDVIVGAATYVYPLANVAA